MGEFIESAQNGFKLLACFVKMVMETTSNFKAMVALHPEKLPQMFAKLTKNPEQLKMYTRFAQAQTHKMFAKQLYQYFLKTLVRSALTKQWAQDNLKVGKYLKTEAPVKRSAIWTSVKWMAFITAYVSATTTLSEPIKNGFDFDEIIKSFNESEGDEDESGSDKDQSNSVNSEMPALAV